MKKYNNTINTRHKNHHGTVGKIYGFGTRASYKKELGGVTFNGYKSINPKKKLPVSLDVIEQAVKDDIMESCMNIDKILPNLTGVVTCVTNVMKETIDTIYSTTQPQITSMFKSNTFATYLLCFDFMTKNANTKNDASWTVISVPNQDAQSIKVTIFSAILNSTSQVNIPYQSGTCITYTGKYVVYHQVISTDDANCVNTCSYTGERTLQNVVCSIIRELNSNN